MDVPIKTPSGYTALSDVALHSSTLQESRMPPRSKCGDINAAKSGAKFCGECGTPIQMVPVDVSVDVSISATGDSLVDTGLFDMSVK